MIRKKILVITDNVKDQINGVVTTFKSIEGLAFADGYHLVYIDPSHFPHVNAPGYPEVKLAWPRGIGKKINEINPDHIHIATEGPVGLAARLWLDSKGLKYNTSYHTKFPEFLKKIYHIPEIITYAYVRWFHKHSGKVLTTTQTMVNDLRNHGFAGQILSWTRGVDRKKFRSSIKGNIECPRPLLLYVGRISKEKNIDAFCQLDYPGATKIAIGDGPYRPELQKKYPNVSFLGSRQPETLAHYYANADVFVFPSLTDTFGIVIIESIACGTPVAAFPVAGPIDILEQDVTGYMSWNLKESVDKCMSLSRVKVEQAGQKWTWDACWQIFKENLIVKN